MRGGNATITASPREVLERLLEEEWGRFVQAATRVLPLPDAEDAVQETAAKAVATLHALEDPDRLRRWFVRILRNECRDRRRRRIRERERRVSLGEVSTEDGGSRTGEAARDAVLAACEGEATYGKEEFSASVRAEVERLPEEMRAVVEGVGMERRSRAAFAREAGIPARTVGHRLCRAFELLRPRLARLMRGLER